jgi:SNF2 family DNA or RNA helicase
VEQWQDELYFKFGLEFEIVTRDMIEASRTGNPFGEKPLLIARIDQVARNEELTAKLAGTDWDLIVVDEAHKMSAHYYGRELKETRRYRLGKLLGGITRHFLLMTATPHAGKEEDFQLFMALLDSDRCEGKFRDGVHTVDTAGLMRRFVKEKLLRFDGRPLFPERRAYSVSYELSDLEVRLYAEVTEYVREEMNRAERLAREGDGKRGAVVGFALTILQRRLASSPEAIYQSLRRRRVRLEDRVHEERTHKRAADILAATGDLPAGYDLADLEDTDELLESELEQLEEQLVDQASAARTVAELEHEIEALKRLEQLADELRKSGTDRKWEELSSLLTDRPEMYEADGGRRKIIIFTEHVDTLRYLTDRIRTLLGRGEAVVTIHGGTRREERRKTQELFTQDKDVTVLVATDAAGEGINLQRAHLMVNYDLPWNPNRIEQRFGRIHRIGQTEVCHLWNLVAAETREGAVFQRLFEKLETQRESLGGQVFDVLGEAFSGQPLRELLLEKRFATASVRRCARAPGPSGRRHRRRGPH